MSDPGTSIALFGGGAAVGALYLGLLWASVRQLARGGRLWVYLFLAALRGGLVLGALWGAVSLGVDALGIGIGLAGFVVIRVGVLRAIDTRHRRDV